MQDDRVCRACQSANLADIINLGQHPLANELPCQANAGQDRFRLNLVLCADCGLVQIDETVPPERLFTDYVYRSSFADSMLSHVEDLVEGLIRDRGLDANSLVIEAASNDGYLLQYYLRRGIKVLGIEPAANIAKIAIEEKGVPTAVRFFDRDTASELAAEGKRCDVFHAHNVFAHVPNPNLFLAGIVEILKPGGVAVIEAPYVRDLIEKLEFDTIYHEHFSYLGASAVAKLAARNGLVLADVAHLPIHGGTLRYYLQHAGAPQSPAVKQILEDEERLGLTRPEYYRAFAARVEALLQDLRARLRAARDAGRTVAAYGASAKGSTLLNSLGREAESIEFTVDRNPLKQGRYLPGLDIPIRPPEALVQCMPDLTVLLTWNFADEIVRQQQAYIDAGGAFLLPVPEPRLVQSGRGEAPERGASA